LRSENTRKAAERKANRHARRVYGYSGEVGGIVDVTQSIAVEGCIPKRKEAGELPNEVNCKGTAPL
jgi:hypothetical protein